MQQSNLFSRLAAGVCAATLAGPAWGGGITITDAVDGQFIDIVGNGGVPLNLGPEDETIIVTAISNGVFPAGNVVVANNGGMSFETANTDLSPTNEPIPSDNAFANQQSLLAFWDDIGNDVGDVYVREDADKLIIQWHDRHFADSDDTSRFQIQVFDDGFAPGPLGRIVAQFLYDDIEQPRAGGGASATIGYQDGGAGFGNAQWSFDTAGAVADGTVLTLIQVPEPASASILVLGLALVHRRRR